MKKIIPLLLTIVIFGLSVLPVNNAFAYTNGLLDGKSSTTGITTLTDNDSTTYFDVYNTGTTYSFSSPATITQVYIKSDGRYTTGPNGGNNILANFFNSSGTSLGTTVLISNHAVTDQIIDIADIANVSSVKIYNMGTNSSTYTRVLEFDVLGYQVVHDELQSLVVTPSYNKVDLDWNIPSNTAFTGSKVYRNGTLIKTLDKSTKVYTDDTVIASTSYTYKITGTYLDGFETTGLTKTITTLEAPLPTGEVTNVKAEPSYNQVNLTWDNPTDADFDKVKIYRDGVFLFESTGTSFKDSTVNPVTDYEYKITTISTEGLESSGEITTVTTLEEPAPAIVAGGYTTDENGDYEFTWEEPTTGQVKILIDGQEYQVADASLLKVLVPKEAMKYDYIGNPKVSLVPISSSGVSGEPTKPDPVDSSSETKVPFSVNDLIGSGMGLLWLIGPFILLALAFLLVPKIRNLVFGSLRKDGKAAKTEKEKDENTRRFHSTETDIKDKQDKLQLERQEKERLERKQRQEKEAIEKSLKQHRQPREPKMKEYKFSRTERTPKEPRIPRAPRIPRDRTRTTRTPRAERDR